MHKSVISKKYRGQGMTSGRFGGWGDVPLLPTPGSGPELRFKDRIFKSVVWFQGRFELVTRSGKVGGA